ncbi:MAG TPA: hypothetical protein VHD62_08240 [Opitutaceae bacterium]|nr:hypothetical protein [Opitutaceae bacterium]
MRLAPCIAVALATALVVRVGRAEEPSAATAKPADAESGIAAAKRDFDTVKAARDTNAANARGELPRIALPEFSPAPSDARPALAPSSATPLPAKSTNWLLDAMQTKPAANRADRNDATNRDERSRELAPFPNESLREHDDATNARQQDAREKSSDNARDNSMMTNRTAAAALNPLARYMGEWMTPQDFALLQPTLGNAKDGAGLAAAPALPGVVGTSGEFDALDLTANFDRGAAKTSMPSAPRENPFLPTLNAPPAVAAPLPAPPPAVSAPTPLFAPTPESAPAKPAIPDFAKPGTDEKYFKPLKRF